MKFNWRANWEILLVLVIIVVGIVVTTLAAIRSKDKHLLVIPDETDYGQLLASGVAANGGANTIASGYSSSEITTTVSPTSKSERKPSDLVQRPISRNPKSSELHSAAAKVQRSTNRDHSKYNQNDNPNRQRANQSVATTTGLNEPNRQTDKLDESNFAADRPQQQASATDTKSFDDNIGQAELSLPDDNGTDSSGSSKPSQKSDPYNKNRSHQSSPATGVDQSFYHDDINDDIHTTRSSMASLPEQQADNSSSSDKTNGSYHSNFNHGNSSKVVGNNSVPYERGSSVSLFAPYRASLHQPTVHADHHLSALHQLHHHHLKVHNQQPTDPPTLESGDMMTSYSKSPSLSNSTGGGDSIGDLEFNGDPTAGSNSSTSFRDRLAAQLFDSAVINSLLNSNSNHFEHHLPNQFIHMKPHTATMPFSLILNDLMKLTRSSQSPLVNPQASMEDPVNSARPQMGILRQLRSFPGPLMALLQGSSGASGSANDMMHSNYDASESNQHYHRISMLPTDVESIIARSSRSSDVLPAFPAPKDVPQQWYPPTMGGNPSVHSSLNNNADFVANNVAGFVRMESQQPPQYNRMDEKSQPSQPQISNSAQQLQQPNLQQQPQQQQVQNTASMPAPQQSASSVATSQQQGNTIVNQHQPSGIWSQYDSPASAQMQFATRRKVVNQPAELFANNIQTYNGMMLQQQHQQNLNRALGTDGINNYQSNVHIQNNALNRVQSNLHSPQMNTNFHMSPHIVTLSSAESVPQASLANAMNPATGAKISLNQIDTTGSSQSKAQTASAKTLNRRRRNAVKEIDDYAEFANDIHSGQGRDEELSVSKSVSVVHPDGSPTKGISIDYRPSRYLDEHDNKSEQVTSFKPSHPPENAKKNKKYYLAQAKKQKARSRSNGYKLGAELDTAGSGLMSKLLLGTASTNDELEDDIDSDDDDGFSDERRKEDGENGDFGGEHPARSRAGYSIDDGTGQNDGNNGGGYVGLHEAQGMYADDPNLGTGSGDKEGYASQRNQHQRSDIDFYGHPGEETRQLKYGILGSGNYEVVNGGIYPEADESTAAVNSVANYVRKPNGLLIADLPRILSGQSDHDNSLGAAFVPGGRLPNTGGFMRVASGAPNELMSLLPANKFESEKGFPGRLLHLIDATPPADHNGLLAAQLGGSGTSARTTFASKDGSNDDESGDSTGADGDDKATKYDCSKKSLKNDRQCNNARHPSYAQDMTDDLNKVSMSDKHWKRKGGQKLRGSNRHLNGGADDEANDGRIATKSSSNHVAPDIGADDDDNNSGSSQYLQRVHGRHGGMRNKNQFNLYQISPSKKVTIFSDQDLDSAPSDTTEALLNS